MTDIPTLPLFIDDFDAATTHLTMEEDGAYNRLMRLCWRTSGCSIPDDPTWICRHMRINMDDFERVVAPIINEFFKRQRGRVYQKRLRAEFRYVSARVQARKDAGKKGGDAKARKTNEINSSKATVLPEQIPSKHLAPNLTQPTVKTDTPKPPKGGTDEFEEWYSHYPRKKAKGTARRAFTKARKKTEQAELITGVRTYAATVVRKDKEFIAYPATWLNGEQWLDSDEVAGASVPVSIERQVQVAKDWLSRNDDIPAWMDSIKTAEVLINEGYDYDKLRLSGFSLPPRGNVVDISEALSAEGVINPALKRMTTTRGDAC